MFHDRMKIFTGILMTLCAFVSVSCIRQETPEVPVTDVRISEDELEMEIGDAVVLTAVVLPENASDKAVAWESTVPSVASVQNGEVTALSVGITYVVAKSSSTSLRSSCKVTVRNEAPEVIPPDPDPDPDPEPGTPDAPPAGTETGPADTENYTQNDYQWTE